MKLHKKKGTKRKYRIKNKKRKTRKGGFFFTTTPSSSNIETQQTLPEYWHEYKGLDGQDYYWNSYTNRFQREFPDVKDADNMTYSILKEQKMDSIPVTNCQCSQGIGVNKYEFPIKLDNHGNVYMEKKNPSLQTSPTTDCANQIDCNIDSMNIVDTDKGCWLDAIVSTKIKQIQKETGANSNEMNIIYKEGIKMGEYNCKQVKEQLKLLLEQIIPNKSCKSFKAINTINIKGHELKLEHLSVLPLVFRLFPNIQNVSIEMNPMIVIDNKDMECLQRKYRIHINFDNNTKILVAKRGV